MDVEIIRDIETRKLKSYIDKRDSGYTTSHMRAGRKILNLIRALKQPKKPVNDERWNVPSPVKEKATW